MKSISFSKRGRRFVPIALSLFFAILLLTPTTLHAAVTVIAENPSNPVGATVTVTVTATQPVYTTALNIRIVDGPNAPYETVVYGSFDESWNVVGTFTYEGNGGAGVDTIEAYANPGWFSQVMGLTTVEWIEDAPREVSTAIATRPKLNVNSQGVLSIIVCGSGDLDVNSLDLDSVQLLGVPALRHTYEDVAGCFDGSDGREDLILKFKTQEIAKALGDVVDGEDRILTVTGTLTDGTLLKADFKMAMIKKGKHQKEKKEKKEK